MALINIGRRWSSPARTGSRRARRLTRMVVAGAVVASVGAVAGCFGQPEPVVFPHPPADTGSGARTETAPTPTLDPEAAAAVEEILTAYRGSVEASVTASRASDPFHPVLDRYLAGAARALVGRYVRQAQEDNLYYDGELRIVSATVTKIDLAAQPPTATVEACLDNSDYRAVDRDTDAPVTGTVEGGT